MMIRDRVRHDSASPLVSQSNKTSSASSAFQFSFLAMLDDHVALILTAIQFRIVVGPEIIQFCN